MIKQLMEKNNCNELHIQYDDKSGCTFIIAMNTKYANKGNGGTRMLNYPIVLDGIKDATKLVKAMTKKCVIIGRKYNGGYSGGKGVIVGNPKTQKTQGMLRRYGGFVESLNGKFQTGSDMNINLKDIEQMAKESGYIDGLKSGLGDTAIPTAYGIFIAMKTMSKWRYGTDSLKDKIIALQGIGNVGKDLIRRLVQAGAKVIATDIDFKKLKEIKKEFNIEIVEPEEIYDIKCNIFSPNACGKVLTYDNIKKLKCDLIVGAANNQLADGLNSVKLLNEKKIIYAPDYVINIGGVFLSMCEVQGKDINYVFEKTKEIIKTRLKQIIVESKKTEKSLFEVAEEIVESELGKSV